MPSPTDPSYDELRALRARAYGPDADIQDDPGALARLQELEARNAVTVAVMGEPEQDAVASASAVAWPLPVPDDGPAPAPGPATAATAATTVGAAAGAFASSHGGTAPEDADPEDDGIPDPAGGPRRSWWRRHIPLLWAASVVAALVLGAGLTLWTQSLDAGHIAVLHEDADADWPTEVWGGPTTGSLAFESFHGLFVLSQPQPGRTEAQPETPCIIVYSEMNGNITYASGTCGAGPFPATATFIVDRSAPAGLRDAFAEGTALQFVLDDTEVHVYAKAPGVVQRTP
ncbi:hypothetical protein [Microbacterium sp. NPDC058389]|uniref:hypothetical protein n=1 Tax=Microbacterium sp. NPDC058389 TaxID=3346475 RepID=UPI00366315F5